MCQFDAELLLLRHQKLHLDWQLKLADLRQLTLYQELLLLKDFERREDGLQEKLNGRVREQDGVMVRGSAIVRDTRVQRIFGGYTALRLYLMQRGSSEFLTSDILTDADNVPLITC